MSPKDVRFSTDARERMLRGVERSLRIATTDVAVVGKVVVRRHPGVP